MKKSSQSDLNNIIVHSIPRRKAICEGSNEVELPTLKKITFPVGAGPTFIRLMKLYYAALRYIFLLLFDKIRRKDSIEQRARRLRNTFENLGGTFIKIGQQLAGRVDLLPQKYCNELAKMMDSNKPFEFKLAAEAVERTIKKPLHEVFQAFDPKPVGSASIACVYLAILKNGDKVAVKVRRPGVGKKFMADCRAFGWLMAFGDLFALSRPGIGANIVNDMRNIFMDELDFRKEIRYMEIFRKRMKKYKRDHITAPRIYPQYSSENVLVSEFVEAYRLTEVLAAVETKNPEALAILKKDNIVPKKLARRLLQSVILGMFDDILFHGDPHPANIMVKPNSKIVMIDFGACGFYTVKKRQAMIQLTQSQVLDDVAGMAEGGIKMVEPIPHVNMDDVLSEMEPGYWQAILANKSKHYEWYEHTQIPIWIMVLETSKKYNFPINPNTLALMRNTMMIDTVVARLHPIKYHKEFIKMRAQIGKYAKRRMRKRLKERESKQGQQTSYLELEENITALNGLVRHVRDFALSPLFRFGYIKSKSSHFASLSLRFISMGLVFTGLYQIFAYVRDHFAGQSGGVGEHFVQLLSEPWFFPVAIVALLVLIRHMLFRTDDMDERLE